MRTSITLPIVISMIGVATALILYLVGTFRVSPETWRNIAYINGTATETLSAGEGAGSIRVIAVVPYNSAIVSWAIPYATGANYRTLALHTGEMVENCAGQITLKEISFSKATFEFNQGKYGCPICIVQGILMRMTLSEEYDPALYDYTSFRIALPTEVISHPKLVEMNNS